MAFFVVFIGVQWFFAEFLISPHAENWFFMSDRIWSYGSSMGKWHHEFWRLDPKRTDADLFTSRAVIISLVAASISSWLGLFFGRWMRKVTR